ncbi:sel1 repeat family protein [bacterium]|nr:sel1 repeat family protein [bacterium]
MSEAGEQKTLSLEARLETLREQILSGLDEAGVQKYIYVQIVSTDSPQGWKQQCLYLFFWGIQNKHFKSSQLDSNRFLILLDNCLDASQRRLLWDFQRSVIDRCDLDIRAYLRNAVTQTQGPERSYLRKFLDSLEGNIVRDKLAEKAQSLREISREEYLALEREQKLIWLRKIEDREFALPSFSLELLYLEEDPFVLSGIAKIFPHILVQRRTLSPLEAIEKFRFLTNHSDSRVRANSLEGFIALFKDMEPLEEAYDIFLQSSRVSDNRVKTQALKGLRLYARTQLLPQLEASLNCCTQDEELKSFEWLLQELNLTEDFAIEVDLVTKRIEASKKIIPHQEVPKLLEEDLELMPELPELSDFQMAQPPGIGRPSGGEIEDEEIPEIPPKLQVERLKGIPTNLIEEGLFLRRLFVFSSFVVFTLVLTGFLMQGKIYAYVGNEYYEKAMSFLDEKDYANAIAALKQAAEYDNLTAQIKLAYMYKLGIGTEPDPKKCRLWLERAVSKDDPEALVTLGEIYWRGEHVETRKDTAYSYFVKAAGQGHPRAQNNLAMMYLFGDGIPLDRKLGLQWLEIAAENGYEPAEENLKVFRSTSQR